MPNERPFWAGAGAVGWDVAPSVHRCARLPAPSVAKWQLPGKRELDAPNCSWMPAVRAQVSGSATRPLRDAGERPQMRRIFVGGMVFALLGAAAGYAMGRWGVSHYLRTRSVVWNNTAQLAALERLQLNEPEQAIEMFESGIDVKAVFFSGWLDEEDATSELASEAACALHQIQQYRRDHPFTSADSEYDVMVATALAHPTDCPNLEARRVTPASEEFDSSSAKGDANPQQRAGLAE